MFKNEVDFHFRSEFTGVLEKDYVIIFDAQDKPLIVFPRAGREHSFLFDYVSMCMRFFETNAFVCAGSSDNPFIEQYKKITGSEHTAKLTSEAFKISNFLDSQKVNKRKKSTKLELDPIEESKVS